MTDFGYSRIPHPPAENPVLGGVRLFIRTVGIARARTKIGLANLVYNMQRILWLIAQAAPT